MNGSGSHPLQNSRGLSAPTQDTLCTGLGQTSQTRQHGSWTLARPWPGVTPARGWKRQYTGPSKQAARCRLQSFWRFLPSRQQVVGALHAMVQQRMAIHAWAIIIPVVLNQFFKSSAAGKARKPKKKKRSTKTNSENVTFFVFQCPTIEGRGFATRGNRKKIACGPALTLGSHNKKRLQPGSDAWESKAKCLRPGSDAWKSQKKRLRPGSGACKQSTACEQSGTNAGVVPLNEWSSPQMVLNKWSSVSKFEIRLFSCIFLVFSCFILLQFLVLLHRMRHVFFCISMYRFLYFSCNICILWDFVGCDFRFCNSSLYFFFTFLYFPCFILIRPVHP